MGQLDIYLVLLGISTVIGLLFNRTSVPVPLILVMSGMLLGFIPGIPNLTLNSEFILDIFLPMVVYPASTNFSWPDVKFNLRPILMLSVGHVVFIAFIVTCLMHKMLPELGWPLCFILGAVIAPPDDAAILAIADKVKFPSRAVTVLTGESLLNDATALILFRFSLAALVTHQFSATTALLTFLLVVIGETLYGFILGHLIGKLRVRIKDPMLQMMVSLLTPFLAYLPAEKMGGCGVLATVVTGFVIGHFYLEKFPPEARLIGRSLWTIISYALQSIVFLLVGLNFRLTLNGINTIPTWDLFKYSLVIVLAIIIGRFIWVYLSAILPRLLFASIRKKDPYPPWQLLFIIAWAGMRGVISLAAVLAVPAVPVILSDTNPKELLIFLVFVVITVTLVLQGLSLPWLIKILGLNVYGRRESFSQHIAEIKARAKIAKVVLHWLGEYEKEIQLNRILCDKVKLRIQEYKLRSDNLEQALKSHTTEEAHDEIREQRETGYLSAQINELERTELLKLWHEKKISYSVRTKILQQLDHRFKHITG